MPNLGPGVDQHVNTTAAAQWVFTPTPGAPATVRLYNEGFSNPVFVGSSAVTAFNGMQLPVGSRPIQLENVTQTLYAVAAVTPGTGTNTVSTAAAAGVSAFTVSAVAGISIGGTVVVGIGNNREAFTVLGTTATSVTVSTASLYAHPTGDTVTTATLLPGQLRVTAGVV